MSTKTRLLILAVFVGVVLFAIFYYLEGINYPYVIRYPILVATVILFIVIVATLAVAMGRRVGVPLPSSALLNYVLGVHNSIELFGFDFGTKLYPQACKMCSKQIPFGGNKAELGLTGSFRSKPAFELLDALY